MPLTSFTAQVLRDNISEILSLKKMVKLTMIARVMDGLPLVEGLDDGRDLKDADLYKQQAKALFKTYQVGILKLQGCQLKLVLTYIIEGRVCFLTLCDRSYPKKLAFLYLEDLKNEFERVYGDQVETAARPYAFIKFDTFIQKTRKLYLDTQTKRNLAKLRDEIFEVHQIMTRNVQEVLGVGEKLDQVSEMSSRLTTDTRIYAEKARDLNRQKEDLVIDSILQVQVFWRLSFSFTGRARYPGFYLPEASA
ncbi:hypothetical protein Scep_010940 [Stephania cephalantha]|uniref:Uncharacterized protein n=1 Tax=Stephania cephalantha TaxID=152367 RepID=A0AAP0JWV2_9MAGN